jgi:hypothetical protein
VTREHSSPSPDKLFVTAPAEAGDYHPQWTHIEGEDTTQNQEAGKDHCPLTKGSGGSRVGTPSS